jgi:aminopeptidase N
MKINLLIIGCVISITLQGQVKFSRQDSLRGSITTEREWWDVTYYHLAIEVLPETREIIGNTEVVYQVLKPYQILQIDLQSPLKITKAEQDGKLLEVISEGNAHFIQLIKPQEEGKVESVTVFYSGKPKEAIRAPWDGGVSWKTDNNGKHFIATSCQGLGASVWWPTKDHMYDEVDSMLISVEVPRKLINVSNGRLREVDENKKKKTKTYHWFVGNPINNYGVNINIGDYVNWSDQYAGEKGDLNVDYWVLKDNEAVAREQFKEVFRMLEAFEYWFGAYPFYEDGYKLVEVPYLGMEHQSSITYGNGFQNGYLGRDLSGTGWGLKFDFIIVHESGHEWFANNITFRDQADMWIHESFTAYSESLFTEFHFGTEAGLEYVRGTRINITNDHSIIGPYQVNSGHHDTDVYYKGANMLNMIRRLIDDDEKWREILRGLGSRFYHQTVETKQIEDYITEQSGLNLKPVFDQYLRSNRVPIFEYYIRDGVMSYRWTNVNDPFDMPLDISVNSQRLRLTPITAWKRMEVEDASDFRIDSNYYVAILKSQ